jgi:broad specificity phosphatase PhoE
MGLITIVRHGQANIVGEDYDQLSDLGRHQSRLLGEYFQSREMRWDHVVTGPLHRHTQTLEEASAVYGSSNELAESARVMPELTEHQAIAVVDSVLAKQGRKNRFDPEVSEQERKQKLREFFFEFDRIMRDWVAGEIVIPGLESWQQARQRCAQALSLMVEDCPAGGDLLAFSSGGFMSMALGSVMGLGDEAVYELSLEINNTAWAEIRTGSHGLRVRCFNWHPHLSDPETVTLV